MIDEICVAQERGATNLQTQNCERDRRVATNGDRYKQSWSARPNISQL